MTSHRQKKRKDLRKLRIQGMRDLSVGGFNLEFGVSAPMHANPLLGPYNRVPMSGKFGIKGRASWILNGSTCVETGIPVLRSPSMVRAKESISEKLAKLLYIIKRGLLA